MEKIGTKYGLLLVLFLLLSVRCTRDVDLELPYVPPRLVLNATVTPGQDVSAYLSKSWFLLDSVPETNVPGGKIRVYINGQLQGNMQQTDIPGDSIHPKGQFCLPGCRAKAGDRVRFEAEASGFEAVMGETLIPGQPRILSVDTARFFQFESEAVQGDRMRLYLKFHDSPVKGDFYRLLVERITEYQKGDTLMVTSSFFRNRTETDTLFYWFGEEMFRLFYEDPVFQSVATNPTLSQLDAYTCRGTFTDAMFNGQDYTVRSVISPVTHSYKDDTVTVKVRYDIRLMAISADYYHYLTEIRNLSIILGGDYQDGLLEPAATYTNVQNGFGVVAGYQVGAWRIEMPFGSKPPTFYPWDDIENIYNPQ